VVVFHYPRDPEKSYIKRVIALPGDRLEIDHGFVWVMAFGFLRNMCHRSTVTADRCPR